MRPLKTYFLVALLVAGLNANCLSAADFYITIAGGYAHSGNQASLEANAIFFQEVVKEQKAAPKLQELYFADGFDQQPDLQIVAPLDKDESELAKLLTSLHRRGGTSVAYRNHQVPNINGSLSPRLVEASMERASKTAVAGDRVIIYVTAHGSRGKDDDEFNTTIDCWSGRKIYARDFDSWLNKFKPGVNVIMVMAQCYCGGFARLVFNDLDESGELSEQLRVGFFAQQHDLAAAGCRPDIDNEEEFSSYFWGAFVGRSRNGKLVTSCDSNEDGTISFSEAYAHAVSNCNSIDIPLRSSDLLLRRYSKIRNYEHDSQFEKVDLADASDLNQINQPSAEDIGSSEVLLTGLDMKLGELLKYTRPSTRRMIEELTNKLGFDVDLVAMKIVDAHREQLMERSEFRRDFRRGYRSRSGRRELLEYIKTDWPDLADRQEWADSPSLKPPRATEIFEQISSTEEYQKFIRTSEERRNMDRQSDEAELRSIKLQRLLDIIEIAVLELNLKKVATPDVIQRYQSMVALEDSSL